MPVPFLYTVPLELIQTAPAASTIWETPGMVVPAGEGVKEVGVVVVLQGAPVRELYVTPGPQMVGVVGVGVVGTGVVTEPL